MTGGYAPGNAAFLSLTQLAALLTSAQPASTSRISACPGTVPRQSMRALSIRRKLLKADGDHVPPPFRYPAAMSVPRMGIAAGVSLSRMILVIFPPYLGG